MQLHRTPYSPPSSSPPPPLHQTVLLIWSSTDLDECVLFHLIFSHLYNLENLQLPFSWDLITPLGGPTGQDRRELHSTLKLGITHSWLWETPGVQLVPRCSFTASILYLDLYSYPPLGFTHCHSLSPRSMQSLPKTLATLFFCATTADGEPWLLRNVSDTCPCAFRHVPPGPQRSDIKASLSLTILPSSTCWAFLCGNVPERRWWRHQDSKEMSSQSFSGYNLLIYNIFQFNTLFIYTNIQ